MSEIRKRNGMVDVLKLLFAIMIIFYHSRSFIDKGGSFLITGGYIAVEFFFIVSGYFLGVSSDKDISEKGLGRDTLSYIGRRVSRLLPELLTASAISLVVRIFVEGLTFKEAVKKAVDAVGEWSFLQQTGFNTGGLLGATWFISAMMIVSFVLFPLARKFRNTFYYVVSPVTFAVIFGFTYHRLEHLQQPNNMLDDNISIGILRCIMEMCLGLFLYGLVKLTKDVKLRKSVRILLTLFELAFYSLIIVNYSYGEHANKQDWYTILALAAVVLVTMSGYSYTSKILKGKVTGFLGEFSFMLYLGHRFWSQLINKITWFSEFNYYQKLPVYLALTVVTSLIIMFCGKLIRFLFAKFVKWIKEPEPADDTENQNTVKELPDDAKTDH